MTQDHGRLRELVFVYEELDPAERQLADAHLRECAECASFLTRLQRLEQDSRLRGRAPEVGDVHLGPEDREQAEASLMALRTRLGTEPSRRSSAGSQPAMAKPLRATPKPLRATPGFWERVQGLPVPFRLAGALAVLVAAWILWPHPPVGSLLQDAELVRRSGARGAQGEEWGTGDAFVLRLELSTPARPVVFHVDSEGGIGLLHPARPDVPLDLMPAGAVTLPAERSGLEWRFEGVPGTETFLVAATSRIDLDLARVPQEARAIPQGSREARIRVLISSIEREIGPTRRLDATHRP